MSKIIYFLDLLLGAQLADDASKKADEAKDAAEGAANTIIGTAIHAKDVAVEKVQEIGHTVSSNLIFILT